MIAFLKTTAAGSLSGLLFGWSLFGWSSSPAPPRVSAWAVDWSASVLRDSLRSLEQGNGAIAEVDLFRWRLSPEGQLADTGAQGALHRRLLATAARQGAVHGVTLVNDVGGEGATRLKDPQVVHEVLADPRRRQGLIETIASRLRESEYETFDLDFERLYAADREAFSDFARELASRLHAEKRRLSITVQPQLRPETGDGPGAQDLAALAAASDEIRIMAYHVHFGTTAPGPAAPLPWVRSLVEYALQFVPRDRLVLALYVGGWRWSGDRGEQLSFLEATDLARTLGVEPRWSTEARTPFFRARPPAGPVEVWYENACSLREKVALAARYHLRGVALWRLGQEDPALYEMLRSKTACPEGSHHTGLALCSMRAVSSSVPPDPDDEPPPRAASFCGRSSR